jgi:DMSO/TMAO reductase YedYZ molybdopterin-dependent catalytic subunit
MLRRAKETSALPGMVTPSRRFWGRSRAPLPARESLRPVTFQPTYYETQKLEGALKPECLLALEMNGEPLPAIHGAPLRLRVENQLGYKMIKWIERIEFVESEKQLGKGEGGSNEDDEYFDLLPNI